MRRGMSWLSLVLLAVGILAVVVGAILFVFDVTFHSHISIPVS